MAPRPTPREVESYYCMAKASDILFTPLEEESRKFLERCAAILRYNIKEWCILYGIPRDIDDITDREYLRGLEPTDWKEQDHYAVLGIAQTRFRATEEDVRYAYRQRCLKHHPDKRQGAGEIINPDGDYFACIVKAFEILGTPKRASWDSVDPDFDDYIPPKEFVNANVFFSRYGIWFEQNSRWSNVQPVPLLGGLTMPRVAVEAFYAFWYKFDSWREFSYLDMEDKEKGQDRDERRWIEKQNKVERAKKKKEEMSRIRTVVDNAYAIDPRISMFREEDSKKKMDIKEARRALAQSKQLEEEKVKNEAEEKTRIAREKLEAEAKERDLINKKEKEVLKKAMKKERKTFRTFCKANNYFANDDKARLENLTHAEHLIEILETKELEELNSKLSKLNFEEGKTVFLESVKSVTTKMEMEKAETTKPFILRNGNSENGVKINDDWKHEDLSLLVKAVNIFPAGTNQRWEVISNFIFQHSQNGARKYTPKEILAKAKDLKASDFSRNTLKKEVNDQAFLLFEKSLKTNLPSESEASLRFVESNGPPIVQVSISNEMLEKASPNSSQTRLWTPDEQKLLEQALKTYPTSDSDRWDRIAACVPGRTRKECMTRFKELAAAVKAKKTAQTSQTA